MIPITEGRLKQLMASCRIGPISITIKVGRDLTVSEEMLRIAPVIAERAKEGVRLALERQR